MQIIKCNLKIADYLDVILNLSDVTHHHFHKPNEETNYIHVESDHPQKIIKKMSRSIEKRLSHLSSTKEIFENSKDCYEQRLQQCGYNEKLNYTEENNGINPNSRKRNILWFNPLYSKSVKTNIGKLFLHLINKHVPPTTNTEKYSTETLLKSAIHVCPTSKLVHITKKY